MQKAMTVLYVVDTYEKGGAASEFFDMVLSLKETYDVKPIILTAHDGKYASFARENGIECHIIGHTAFLINEGSTVLRSFVRIILRPVLYARYRTRNFLALKKTIKYIDFSEIDIIHSNSNRNDIGAILAKKYNKPHIWHLREFVDLDYKCFSLRGNYIAYMNNLKSTFVAVSDAVKSHWVKKGVRKEGIVRIYDGVNSSFCKHKKSKDDSAFKIVMTGFVSEIKGQKQVIEAISLLDEEKQRKICFDIYGEGAVEYISYLKHIIKKNRIKSTISFKGYVDNLNELLVNYDIGCNCSRAEGFGLVTVEYMLAGVAVIASDRGANTELIINNKSGLIYSYGNINDLKNKIELLIDNKDYRKKLAKNGQNFALKNYTIDINAQNIMDLYNKVHQCASY